MDDSSLETHWDGLIWIHSLQLVRSGAPVGLSAHLHPFGWGLHWVLISAWVVMLSTALQSRAHIGDISVVPRRANRLQLPWPPRAGPTSFTSRTSHTSHLCAELTPGAVVLLLGTLTRQHGEQVE